LADGNKPRVFRFDETAITGLTFGPDLHRSVTATNRPGWVLAAGDSAGRITVWDLRTFCHGGQFLGSHFEVQAIAFSPDGMTLVSGGRTPNECWDLATGRSLLHLAAGDDITGLSFTAHGQKLAVSSKARFSAGQVEVWQLEFGRGIRTLLGLATEVTKVRFSRDGQWLAALSLDWRVAMWNLKETRLRYVIKVPAGASADNAALRFSPDSQQFAFCAGTQATVWATASGQISQTWPLPPGLCDVLTWHEPKKLLLFRGETVDGVPPYGNDATKHPRVCVLRNLRGESSTKPLFTFPDFNWHLWNATAPESGRFFIVLGERSQGKTRTIQAAAYDSRSGTNLWTIPPGLLGGASTFVVDPEGTRLIGSTAAVLVLIDTASGHWHKNAGPVMKAISHSGTNWLVEGMPGVHDRGWSVFAAGRKEPLVTLGIDAQRSYLPEFSSNDRLVAWGNTDGTVTVCDLDEMRRHLSKTGLGW
jgi:WD40 repeat protein